MPTISIFVRKGDLPKWKALPNKSEWLHDKLSYEEMSGFKTTGDVTVVKSSDKEWEAMQQLYEPKPFVPKPPDPELGYPCCQQKRPCKHWSFDGATSTWVNELTGKTKEVIV